jgi:hypothetical protein
MDENRHRLFLKTKMAVRQRLAWRPFSAAVDVALQIGSELP